MDRPEGSLVRLMVVFLVVGVVSTALALYAVFGMERGLSAPDAPPPAPGAATTVAVELPAPVWIWAEVEGERAPTARFERRIELEDAPVRATLIVTCDNTATVTIDEAVVAECTTWQEPLTIDITPHLSDGDAVLSVDASNEGGPAGLLAMIELKYADGRGRIVSDEQWTVADGALAELGAHGTDPWGELPGFPAVGVERDIEVADGFAVELVYTVRRDQGSWVAITADDEGRLITSSQGPGLYRFAPGDEPELLHPELGGAQGLLALGDDLYCVVATNLFEGPGLYRLRDTDGDDTYDETRRLRALSTGGEHGPHAILQGPDDALYIVAGNHTKLPEIAGSVVPRHWGEDQLLPRLWDPRGHAVGYLAPGGWICRTDRDGEDWELVACGFRNTYDIAFNADGELFTYDADMEWDMGAPWYRPTRINHVISGADFGWRSGSGKWPSESPESMPSTHDIGPGSPTGLTFGTGANFPPPYDEALFAADWTFGTIYALFTEPDGTSYRATREPFVTGRPLPIADMVVNPKDGALYFAIGGRGTPSAVYRVVATGEAARPAEQPKAMNRDALARRRTIEAFHGEADPAAISEVWASLADPDRATAHAARVALEFQPAADVMARLASESDETTRLAALLALARMPDTDAAALGAELGRFSWDDLSTQDQLTWIRAWTLALIRHEVDAPVRSNLAAALREVYPTGDTMLDRPLCDLLVYLGEATVVSRTIALMEQVDTDEVEPDAALLARNDKYGKVISAMAEQGAEGNQLHYAHALSHATSGWTDDLRERYFAWFDTARERRGGLSYSGFVDAVRKNALAALPEADQERYASPPPPDPTLPVPEGPGRAWTVDSVMQLAARGLADRDLENGHRMYQAASCARCHRFGGAGATSGPDLTALATRFTLRDVIEATIEPSRVISDQYAMSEFLLNDDTVALGRVVGRNDETVRILPTLLAPDFIREIPVSSIVSERVSPVSPMQSHLLDALNEDEVLDLFAYLLRAE